MLAPWPVGLPGLITTIARTVFPSDLACSAGRPQASGPTLLPALAWVETQGIPCGVSWCTARRHGSQRPASVSHLTRHFSGVHRKAVTITRCATRKHLWCMSLRVWAPGRSGWAHLLGLVVQLLQVQPPLVLLLQVVRQQSPCSPTRAQVTSAPTCHLTSLRVCKPEGLTTLQSPNPNRPHSVAALRPLPGHEKN